MFNTTELLWGITSMVLCGWVLIWSSRELFAGSIMVFRFYLPYLIKSNSDNEIENYAYIFSFLAVTFSILAVLNIFQTILCSGYFDGFKYFELFFLLSASFSVGVFVLNSHAGYNVYERYIEKKFYLNLCQIGDYICDRLTCVRSAVYYIHQEVRCCGWDSKDELVLDNNGRLPQFCCYRQPNQFIFCNLNSTNVFNRTCNTSKDYFWRISNADFSSADPTSVFGFVFKLFIVYGYALARRQMLLPTSDSRFNSPQVEEIF